MQTIHNIPHLHTLLKKWRSEQQRVAFVPTMGNLHNGHLRLVQEALQQADRVLVSIFVNPLQFNNLSDLENYPRTIQADCNLLAEHGVHATFCPEENEMVATSMDQQTKVIVPELSDILCGASRPGHFVGVTTIVAKLFNIVQPHVAIFGEKDYQQLLLIRRMVADLCLPIEIIAIPTERDTDGLALSSRNNYLNLSERATAPLIYETLKNIKDEILAGNIDYQKIINQGTEKLNAAGFKVDYLAICETNKLNVATLDDKDIIILIAAFLGKARLIDNVRLSLSTAKNKTTKSITRTKRKPSKILDQQ